MAGATCEEGGAAGAGGVQTGDAPGADVAAGGIGPAAGGPVRAATGPWVRRRRVSKNMIPAMSAMSARRITAISVISCEGLPKSSASLFQLRAGALWKYATRLRKVKLTQSKV